VKIVVNVGNNGGFWLRKSRFSKTPGKKMTNVERRWKKMNIWRFYSRMLIHPDSDALSEFLRNVQNRCGWNRLPMFWWFWWWNASSYDQSIYGFWPKPSMFADMPIANHQKLVREPSTWMSVQWPSCIAGGQCLPWIEKKTLIKQGGFLQVIPSPDGKRLENSPVPFFLGDSAIFKVKVLVRMVNAARSSCYCSTLW
jgi:hypothetical protein